MKKVFSVVVTLLVVMLGFVLLRGGDYKGAQHRQGTIVAFGDSLTYGPEVANGENYPAQLQELLNKKGYTGFKVINMGVNGNTTADGIKRMREVISQKPDIVIVTLGGNDFLQRLDPVQAKKNLDAILFRFKAAEITTIIGGMKAVGPQVSSEYKTSFNTMYRELADKYHMLLIEDFLEDVRLRSEYNLADNIHPNARGYGVIVNDNIWPVLKKVLR